MPVTECGAGREADPCLPAVLAELEETGRLTGSFAGAVEESSDWTVKRKDRGQVMRPEGSHRRRAIFVFQAGRDKRLCRRSDGRVSKPLKGRLQETFRRCCLQHP